MKILSGFDFYVVFVFQIDEKTRLIQNEIEKYGELVQTVYDTLDTKDVMSPEFGKCNPDAMRVGVQLKEYDNKSITVSTEAREYMVQSNLNLSDPKTPNPNPLNRKDPSSNLFNPNMWM